MLAKSGVLYIHILDITGGIYFRKLWFAFIIEKCLDF